MVGAWEQIDERVVYDGHRTVVKRSLRKPGGSEGEYDVVVHDAVAAVLALTPEQEVILVRRVSRIGFRQSLEGIGQPNRSVDDAKAFQLQVGEGGRRGVQQRRQRRAQRIRV